MHMLHQRALLAAKKFREAEGELLTVLQLIDQEKIFLGMGYSSLFKYAVEGLGLSEANAYNFIHVARKAVEIPELKENVVLGRITLSNARKIAPMLTAENKNHWLKLAETLPKPALEREIAKTRPDLVIQQRTRAVSSNRHELKFGVSDEFLDKLKRAQDHVSQKIKAHANFESTIEFAIDCLLAKSEPVLGTGKISIRRQVKSRDQHRCTFTSREGVRCTQTRWLDIHHIQPRAEGGADTLENLTTLCANHHHYLHRIARNSSSTQKRS